MSLATLFYRIPRLTILAVLIALAAGVGAIISLGRQEDPTIIERFGIVNTVYPGTDASRIETLITDPLEEALLELPEVEELISYSRSNVSQISISMAEDLSETQVDEAWNLVRQQIDIAKSEMPADVQEPELIRFFLGATTIVVGFGWDGEGDAPMPILNRLAVQLEKQFQNYGGTEETSLFGAMEEEIHVIPDNEKLTGAGVSIAQLAQLVASADSKAPAGEVQNGSVNLGLEITGEFDSIGRIREVPVKQGPDGVTLRIGDIADVRKVRETPPETMALVNNKPVIMVGAIIEPNSRVDIWSDGIIELIDDFRDTLPEGVTLNLLFNQSDYTESRLNGLTSNLLLSALIVFLVLFIFMGWRAALIVGAALPLTICLVLILFRIFNIPLHQMSVTGLVISLGLLIDNAIVVVDEFEQKRAKGESRVEAITHSLNHLFAPLSASTLTTVLAFAPIALLTGPSGEFVGMIGVSVIFSVVSSFLIAMTVVAACAGWFDRERGLGRPRRFWRDGVRFDLLSEGYRWSITQSFKYPLIPILISLAMSFSGFYLTAVVLPGQFFPQTDRDQFQVDMQLSPDATIFEAEEIVRRATDLIMEYPGVERVHWTIGEGAPRVYYNSFNQQTGVSGFAAGWVKTDSADTTLALLPALQKELRSEFPEARFLALPFEQGPPTSATIEFFINGSDIDTLEALGDEMRRALLNTTGITYTWASMELGTPTFKLEADEISSGLAGLRLNQIAADLNAELSGIESGSVFEGNQELPVRVIASDERRGSLTSLRDKRFAVSANNPSGTPLSALGELNIEPEVAVISHRNGTRSNIISASVEPFALPTPIEDEFYANVDASDVVIPKGYEIVLGGQAAEQGSTLGALATNAIPLIIAMAGCVALVFNSFRMAALILSTGFLSIGLAFIGVWAFGLPFGFTAIIGAMGLLGISINGSIVVLSTMRASPEALAGDREAQIDTVIDATRHIVATTLTTMGGFVPLILAGDRFWLPLASSISLGVGGSAILALYFVPTIFTLAHRPKKERPATQMVEGTI